MIFITGVSGFIGSNLANFLHLEGHEVIGLDNNANCPTFLAKTDRFHQTSANATDKISEIFRTHPYEMTKERLGLYGVTALLLDIYST